MHSLARHWRSTVILSFALSVSSAWAREGAKPVFTSVPEACSLALSNSIAHLKSHVDWTSIRNHMISLGYPSRIVDDKLNAIAWNANYTRATIQNASGNSHWNWGDAISHDTLTNLARLPIATQIINELPFWSSLEGFDSASFVREFIKQIHAIPPDTAHNLAFSAPVWLQGPEALEMAKNYFAKSIHYNADAIAAAGWLMKALSEEQAGEFKKFAGALVAEKFHSKPASNGVRPPGDYAQEDISYLAIFPLDQIPEKVRASLNKDWLNLEKYPPVTHGGIDFLKEGYQPAGNCQMMTNGHMCSLGLATDDPQKNTNYRESILIKVKGMLVGSLKMTGDPSMIALRNVMDNQGRLVLAMGGVYHIPQDVFEKIKATTAEPGHWRTVDLDSLQVHPWHFMLNNNAWVDDNFKLMVRAAKDHLSSEQFVSIIESNFTGWNLRNEGQAAWHHPIWAAILARIEQVRAAIERGP